MYFRELPNPVCTYHLYEKFVEAAKAPENQRLVLMRDVVQQLPPPNYRYEQQKLAQFCQLFTFCKKKLLRFPALFDRERSSHGPRSLILLIRHMSYY